MMEFDGALTLFLDVVGTIRASIEFNELFVTEADDFALIMPYALKVYWRLQIADRVHEDLLFSLPEKDASAISALLMQDRFTIVRCDDDAPDAPCLHSSSFHRLMIKAISTPIAHGVAIRLPITSMTARLFRSSTISMPLCSRALMYLRQIRGCVMSPWTSIATNSAAVPAILLMHWSLWETILPFTLVPVLLGCPPTTMPLHCQWIERMDCRYQPSPARPTPIRTPRACPRPHRQICRIS
jgi:hypothetical protein